MSMLRARPWEADKEQPFPVGGCYFCVVVVGFVKHTHLMISSNQLKRVPRATLHCKVLLFDSFGMPSNTFVL